MTTVVALGDGANAADVADEADEADEAGPSGTAGEKPKAPSSAGFHQTTRKATARPRTTALERNFNAAPKLFNSRLPVASEGPPDPSNYDVLCIMRPVLCYTNHGFTAADAKIWQSFVEG